MRLSFKNTDGTLIKSRSWKSRSWRGIFLGAACGVLVAAAGTGCGGDDQMNPDNMNADMSTPPTKLMCSESMVTGSSNKAATNKLIVPSTAMSYSYDIDGDGRPENQLKNLINTVMLAGLSLQDPIDQAVAKGQAVILMDLKTPDLTNASCSQASLSLAEAPAAMAPLPKFDGTDTFKTATGIMQVKLYGDIKAGKLNTVPPKDQTAATEQKIDIELPLAGANLRLAIHGAHIEGEVKVEKSPSGADILKVNKGAIHGVISKNDIDTVIVPTVATLLTDMVNKDPMGDTAKAIIGLFESKTGATSKAKCMVDADCCAKSPKTCKILPAEVTESAIGGVLSPDVEAFDAQGKWGPKAGGKNYNGMSVGLGFTAIQASF